MNLKSGFSVILVSLVIAIGNDWHLDSLKHAFQIENVLFDCCDSIFCELVSQQTVPLYSYLHSY